MIEGEKFTVQLVHPKRIVGVVHLRSLRISLDLRGIGSTDRTCSVSLEPLVYTLGVELVITRQDP